jgi:hypothetical protein
MFLEVFYLILVSRTGYNETDLTDNKASNTKMDFICITDLGNEDLEVLYSLNLVLVMQFIKVQTGII